MAIALPLAVCRKLLLSIDTPVCVRCENQPDRTLLCLVKPMTQGLGVARACLLDAQHTITEDNADLLTGSDFYNIQVWHALEERCGGSPICYNHLIDLDLNLMWPCDVLISEKILFLWLCDIGDDYYSHSKSALRFGKNNQSTLCTELRRFEAKILDIFFVLD
eukprot:c19548_g3_i7.p1 GENE.c19548_g3_i7~~c19548_g3_i7.p1  ORF type:complete len:163 (+),score=23.45 c19548_g3_i7:39-527(+)